MKYDPKDANKCFPAGTYKAALREVVDSDENGPLFSKSGVKMEYWNIEVYGPEGRKFTIRNYVTADTAAWQYKRLASAVDQEAVFKSGDFEPKNFIDSIFEVELEIKEYNGQDQNQIKKIGRAGQPTKVGAGTKPTTKPLTEDDIPF